MRERYLTAIWNAKGLHEYDIGGNDSDNITTFVLSDAEFKELFEHGVFKKTNEECHLLIDDYENEIINKEAVKKCLDILKESHIKSKVFVYVLNSVYEEGLAVAIDF